MKNAPQSSPSNVPCVYCGRLLDRVATKAVFLPDSLWNHSRPAMVCAFCDRASAIRTTAA